MSFLTRHARVLVVAVSCLAVGAAVSAIATAGAASPGDASTSTASAGVASTRAPARARTAAAHRLSALRRIPGVHAEIVVHTRRGFRTLTLDRGFVQSVSGDTLTMTEAMRTATYKTVALTIPANARIRNNGRAAALASLTRGEHVLVIQGLPRTRVIARTGR